MAQISADPRSIVLPVTMQYQIIHWRDIPARVRVRVGRKRTAYSLSDRFQQTIYRAAYRAKAITGDAYAGEWRAAGWFDADDGGGETPEQMAVHLVAMLEAAYNDERLDQLARNKGYEPAAEK